MELPFKPSVQLDGTLNDVTFEKGVACGQMKPTVPGFPRVRLDKAKDTVDLLVRDLYCEKLERMADRLWVLSTHSHKNITPLHRQSFRGRAIAVMEDPALHLVWIHDRIFIKPLPRYLMSHAFWEGVLAPLHGAAAPDEAIIVPAALGLLRTYYYLIQYESDFRIAQREDLQLIPKGITYTQFCDFCSAFADISDEDVLRRYQYGELRLTRLNMWAFVLLRTNGYLYIGRQYIDEFAPYFTPLLFIFGVLAILLNAMQVGLAVEQINPFPWSTFLRFCRWFAIVSIFLTVVPSVILLSVLLYKIADEWIYVVRQKLKVRAQRRRAQTKDPGSNV